MHRASTQDVCTNVGMTLYPSPSMLPTLGKRRLDDSPAIQTWRAQVRSRALDFSDSGSPADTSDQSSLAAGGSSTGTNAETESAGSSSRPDPSFEADLATDTRVLIPAQPHTTPKKTPKKSPMKLHCTINQPHLSSSSRLYDPICFGFFSPHNTHGARPESTPRFPECLRVVLRHASELQSHPGQDRWRRERKIALEQDDLLHQMEMAVNQGSVVSTAAIVDQEHTEDLVNWTRVLDLQD